ncbi:hypothetical protein QT970_20660, partial [Microcoleus sp. herbarium8]|uniref:hypothetical protein n=1 Tax=Microcoleus sp. herbarium8 TaxID=3055436 RepID=UPI002FD2B595
MGDRVFCGWAIGFLGFNRRVFGLMGDRIFGFQPPGFWIDGRSGFWVSTAGFLGFNRRVFWIDGAIAFLGFNRRVFGLMGDR